MKAPTKKLLEDFHGLPTYKIVYSSNPLIAIPTGLDIYDDWENRVVFIPTAGYSKDNRQRAINSLLVAAKIDTPLDNLDRLGNNISISLANEIANQWDSNAILILARYEGADYTIGYIPSTISRILTEKREWFKDEDIIIFFRKEGDYIRPQLAISYDDKLAIPNRFKNMQYE